MHGSIKFIDIFEAANKTIIDYEGFQKYSFIVNDRVKVLTSTVTGIFGLLKQNGIDFSLFDCIIHQETLYWKSLRQMNAMKVAIKITNFIRKKNNAKTILNLRIFNRNCYNVERLF